MTKEQTIRKKEKSFTLVELMVVISIIVILSLIMIPNYRSFQKDLALRRAAIKLAQDIRRVQGIVMAATECEECGGGVPSTGYGIHFKLAWGTYYKIYADDGNEKYGGGDTQIGNDIYLEKGIFIYSVSPSSLSINFKPPDPIIKIETEAGVDQTNATITLCIEGSDCLDPTKTKAIAVNKAGLVAVE